MPKFTDVPQVLWYSPPGDRILQVVAYDKDLTRGAKTAGATRWRLKLLAEPTNTLPASHLHENLIEHESCIWKLESFLKSCGIVVPKGEGYTFDENEARREVWQYIPLIGLRGWATIGDQKQEAGSTKKYNEVVAWITNKEKLPRLDPPETKPEDDDIPF